jgi:hypothetical protein
MHSINFSVYNNETAKHNSKTNHLISNQYPKTYCHQTKSRDIKKHS